MTLIFCGIRKEKKEIKVHSKEQAQQLDRMTPRYGAVVVKLWAQTFGPSELRDEGHWF